jgi:mannose-6-phosphate isomerase class I
MAVRNYSNSFAISHLAQPTAPTVVHLAPGTVQTLHRSAQIIRVISGCAWITYGGEDYVVNAGAEIVLKSGQDAVVIGSALSHSLVFEIQTP